MTPRELVLVGLIVACLGVMAYLGHRIDAMNRDTYRPAAESSVPVHVLRELLSMQHAHSLELANAITQSTVDATRETTSVLRSVVQPVDPLPTITPLSEPIYDGSDITDFTLPHPAIWSTPGAHIPQPEDDDLFPYPPVGHSEHAGTTNGLS